MQLLIRYIKKKGQGDVSEQVLVNGNTLLIGRGTNQNILLPDPRVALMHAKLSVHEDGGRVVASSGKFFLYNDQMVKTCTIAVGENIDIADHKITLLAGEEGCDFVVQVNLSALEQEPLQNRYKVTFNDLKLHKRRWSWILFLLVISLGLLLPFAGVLSPSLMEQLRESPLPDDKQWIAGDLITPHKFIGDDCATCHVNAFEPVNNQACQSCHTNVKQHIDVNHDLAMFDKFNQCASCHNEHNPREVLAEYSQQYCLSCHSDLKEDVSANIKQQSVTNFSSNHPTFSVSLLQPVMELEKVINWQSTRHLLSDPDLTELSNLKFPHDIHMDPKGLKSAEGDVQLACSNCHEPEKDGMEMKAISMEQHCQSCHQLTFDPDDPERVVPHGEPAEVVLMMREYYAFRFIYQNLNKDINNAVVKAGDLFEVRNARRPGRDDKLRKSFEQALTADSVASIAKLTKQTVRTEALVWAESRANQAASSVFERQACNVCHVVTKDETLDVPWKVEPVVLTKEWLPLADFSHDGHQSMTCAGCHDAQSSKQSADILIPDIKNCRQCHGDQSSDDLIPNTCIDCHGYHEAEQNFFSENKEIHHKNKTSLQNNNEQ
jgi:predicted CXXCH cytochrome family protein